MSGATFREASLQDAATILRLMQGCYAEDGYAFDARERDKPGRSAFTGAGDSRTRAGS